MAELTEFIKTLGFPIFVSVWLLIRDAKEKETTRAILIQLKEAIDELKNRICFSETKKVG